MAGTCEGQAGDDQLWAGLGPDLLLPGSGRDDAHGGPGYDGFALVGDGDTAWGGPPAGSDMVTYLPLSGAAPDAPVTVDLSQHLGGASGSPVYDQIYWVSDISGSDHADTLIGDDGPNVIFGNASDDVLDGRGGSDVLDGEAGSDECLNGEELHGCELVPATPFEDPLDVTTHGLGLPEEWMPLQRLPGRGRRQATGAS